MEASTIGAKIQLIFQSAIDFEKNTFQSGQTKTRFDFFNHFCIFVPQHIFYVFVLRV
jgi:hypothetical protein